MKFTAWRVTDYTGPYCSSRIDRMLLQRQRVVMGYLVRLRAPLVVIE